MNDLLAKLESKLTEKKSQRERLDGEITELEIALRIYRQFADNADLAESNGADISVSGQATPSVPATTINMETKTTPTLPQNLAGMSIVEAATQVLQEHGMPMHYRAIAHAAFGRGYRSGRGSDPEINVLSFSQLLRRAAQTDGPIVAMGGGMFGLMDWSGENETEHGQQE